jgi:predicted transcriptional regulator
VHGRRDLEALFGTSILKPMEVHFTLEQEAQLSKMAAEAGTNPERFVKDILVRYLDDEAQFLTAVEKGIAAAERGEFIEEEVMDERIEHMFKP